MNGKRSLWTMILLLATLATASAQVIINEVLYDTPGTDNPDSLFTELWGPPGFNLTGWTLVGINGNGGTEYRTVTLNGTIPADGYFVVGNTANVRNVDQVLNVGTGAGVDWQNAGFGANNECDGIDLRNPQGVTVDHLCYGTCAAGQSCTGEGGSNAPDYDPPAGGPWKSIGRYPDHTDTDNNGADWRILDVLTPGLPNANVPCNPRRATLSQLRQQNANFVPLLLDTFVIVRGIVNVNNYTLDSAGQSKFFVQDDLAGVCVFRGTNIPPNIIEGDCVVVSAWVYQYNGLTELVSSGIGDCVYEVAVTGHVAGVDTAILTCASSFEPFEGMLARINDLTIVSGGWPPAGVDSTLIVTDGTGTLRLRLDRHTALPGSPPPTPPFAVVGIITQNDYTAPYNDYYEITPRYLSDIISASGVRDAPTAATAGSFRLLGCYPNPFNSATEIRFEVGAARELELAVFDVLGRAVMTRQLRDVVPGANSIVWTADGASGVYLVRLSSGAYAETAKVLLLK